MFGSAKLSCFETRHGVTSAFDGALPSGEAAQCQQQTVDAAGPVPMLPGRSQADAAHSLAMRPAENVPVYVMLPLDTVNAEGVFKYAYVPWFAQALHVLALSGVHGVAVDVWWCATERAPRQYVWTGYKQLFQMVRASGLKLQVVLSFHACGGNVGDMVQVPLPPWVLQAGLSDPDLFFTDRPRETGLGQRNKEYLSIWADDCNVLPAGPHPATASGSFAAGGRPTAGGGLRTPLQCYGEFMVAFRDEFAAQLGTLIEEVVVGSGPCGELRYPSYVAANGWRFPGVGEFQCYDRRALASLAAAAEAAGHPEWGYAGPHDCGGYNSRPLDTDFFKPHGGSWDTDYGNFFLSWYSACLLQHGERLLQLASQVFAPYRTQPCNGLLTQGQAILRQLQQLLQSDGSSSSDWGVAAAAAAAAVAAAAGDAGAAAAAEASIEGAVQQALGLLQQLAACRNGVAPWAAGSNSSCASSPGATATVPPAATSTPAGVGYANGATAPAAGLPNGVPAAAAAAAMGNTAVPQDTLEAAVSVLQQLLQSGVDAVSSSNNSALQPPAAVGGASTPAVSGLSAGVAAAVAAAAGVPVAAGSSNTSSGASSAATSPLPAAAATAAAVGGVSNAPIAAADASVMLLKQQQSCSSDVSELSTHSMLSASQQHLAGLSLIISSKESSDLGSGQVNNSNAQQQVPYSTPAGVAQLLQPAPSAVEVAVAAAAEGLQAEPICNGASPGVAAAGSSSSMQTAGNSTSSMQTAGNSTSSMQTAGNSSSSDMSCTTTPPGPLQTAAGVGGAAPAGPAAGGCGKLGVAGGGSSSSCSMEYGGFSSSSPGSSSASPFIGRSSSVTSLAADSNPLLQLFLQLLIRAGVSSGSDQRQQQQQQQQQQQGRRLQQHLQRPRALVLSLKIAGVHWWYNSTSHASELTAGYYNTDTRDGYSPILELCERYNVNLTITCVEMCDAQHPSYALCGPEGLLRQIRAMAAHRSVTLSGENALPIFTANGIDGTALDRVVSNVRACPMASLRSCSSWPGPGIISSSGGTRNPGSNGGYGQQQHQQLYPNHQQQQLHQQQHFQQPWEAAAAAGGGGLADGLIKQQHTGAGPGSWQQHQHQQQRLLQQQSHHQQMLWFGADRMGSNQHTSSHITSNSRNFSELGTLLQVYGSSGSGGSGPTPAAGGGGAYCGGFWQRGSNSSILGGRSSPNSESSSTEIGGISSSSGGGGGGGSFGLHSHQQHQQHRQQHCYSRRLGSSKGVTGPGSEAELLPAMRAFTFLRLGPEILQPACHTSWMRFMHRMLNERA